VDIITATNVFAHLNNLADFLQACRNVLHIDGILVIENPYLIDTIINNEFDQFYFEHCSYWSLLPMITLCMSNKMKVIHAEKQAIHGGSMRYIITKQESIYEPDYSIKAICEYERLLGFDKIGSYLSWSDSVKSVINEFSTNLLALKKQGKSIIGFAASAKGVILLNSAGINTDIMKFIVDETAEKIGKYSPGTGIPIVYKQMIMKENPDYIVILSWNFKEEIIEKIKALGYKGKYIIPIPVWEILE